MPIPEFLNDPASRTVAGFLLAAMVATLAMHLRALTRSGAFATTALGGAMVAAAGWWAGLVLVVYFVTSSALSSIARRRRGKTHQARGEQRDAIQVLANGGIPVAAAMTGVLLANPTPWTIASLAAIAGAAADTWATETGRFSSHQPRLITTGRTVPAGTSGAVSPLGSAGSLAGALVIGFTAAAGYWAGLRVSGLGPIAIAAAVIIGGCAGSVGDSVLGATVQETRRCPKCNEMTELHQHVCGSQTVHTQGWRWVNNDTVNLASIMFAGLVGGLLAILWQAG